MRKHYLALIALGSLLGIGVVILGLGLTRPAPALPNPLTPVVMGDPLPILPAQPISQTIQGYTATLVPVYADANRITFTYMLAGPPRAYPYGVGVGGYGDPVPRLIGSGGTDFPWLQEASDSGQPGDFDYATGQLHLRPARLVFDGIVGAPTTTLSLHLALPLRISDAPYFPPAPTAVAPLLITPTSRPAPETFTLPFAFDLQMPFDPRRRAATPNQTVLTNGVAITLERATVTASEARLVLRYASVGTDMDLWEAGLADGSVAFGQEALPFGAGITGSGFISRDSCDSDGRCVASYVAASLLDRPSSWTLRLDNLLSSAAPSPPPVPGPWIFAFTLPPLSPPATP